MDEFREVVLVVVLFLTVFSIAVAWRWLVRPRFFPRTLMEHFQFRRDCPECRGTLLSGPEGSLCINVKCAQCGAKYNLGFFDSEVIHAERLPA